MLVGGRDLRRLHDKQERSTAFATSSASTYLGPGHWVEGILPLHAAFGCPSLTSLVVRSPCPRRLCGDSRCAFSRTHLFFLSHIQTSFVLQQSNIPFCLIITPFACSIADQSFLPLTFPRSSRRRTKKQLFAFATRSPFFLSSLSARIFAFATFPDASCRPLQWYFCANRCLILTSSTVLANRATLRKF